MDFAPSILRSDSRHMHSGKAEFLSGTGHPETGYIVLVARSVNLCRRIKCHFRMANAKQASIECVLLCVVALLVDLVVLPMFYKATGAFAISGLATTATGAALCVWAYGRRLSRALVSNTVVRALMSLALLICLHG